MFDVGETFKTVCPPAQKDKVPVMEGAEGRAFTFVVMELEVLEHPFESVTISENVPDVEMEMVSVVEPLLHVPDALATKFTLPPKQKVVADKAETTAGVGRANSLMVMLAVSVAVITV